MKEQNKPDWSVVKGEWLCQNPDGQWVSFYHKPQPDNLRDFYNGDVHYWSAAGGCSEKYGFDKVVGDSYEGSFVLNCKDNQELLYKFRKIMQSNEPQKFDLGGLRGILPVAIHSADGGNYVHFLFDCCNSQSTFEKFYVGADYDLIEVPTGRFIPMTLEELENRTLSQKLLAITNKPEMTKIQGRCKLYTKAK